MTDPNQTPAATGSTPPGYPQSDAPAYDKTVAPAYGAAPDAPAAYAPPAYSAPGYGAPGYGAPTGQDKWNVLAIISLVSAFFFVSLASVICGHIALSQIKKTGERGRGLAIAGVVLGYLGLVAGLIAAIVFVVVIVAAVNSGYSTY